ncbi:MAG: 16S rRNA (guanine(527)-N(7))-methyltransferase RsmG [Clostridia bacterium]|nr:16S rRNA (guanine(527)-N(7))-methyltransferase RsmG [Clostridia bacterium]
MADIAQVFSEAGRELTAEQEELFVTYRDYLKEYNEKVNLTAITDDNEIAVKHFLDSVLGEKFLPQNATVVDVGSGAGFPAVPLKIVRPDLKFLLMDSLNKRVVFLSSLIEKLNLSDISPIHARAEEGAKIYREKFDAAVARAVAPLPTLLEYVLPLVRVGGVFVAYKGNADEELKQSERALRILGGKLLCREEFSLQGDKRTVLVFEKTAKTPEKYPRLQNKPRISPL